jgi:hypothetical protein
MEKFAIARGEKKTKIKGDHFAKPKEPKPAVTVTPMPVEEVVEAVQPSSMM